MTAAGLRHPALAAGAPYDLIFANILARPLAAARAFHRCGCDLRCRLILSGLLARDVAGVLSAYRGQGYALAERIDLEAGPR